MSNFATLLSDVKTAIEQLRSFMAEGNPADLDTLAPKLDAMNSALVALPKEEGKQHINTLLEIDQALAELRQDFIRQREGSEAALTEITTRLKASTAYAKSAAAIDRTDEST